MRGNRIGANGLRARTQAGCKRKPQVLICASGMGIYPPAGETVLTEESPVGTDFLAQLQCDGEAATASASAAGIRMVNLRIPAVLGGPNLKRNIGRLAAVANGRAGYRGMSWLASWSTYS